MSISSQLGERKEITLDQGTIRYRDSGKGEPIVFVHGLLVNGDLWRKVVPELSKDFRCIAPDWPLGSHELAMNRGADLTPRGLAEIVADFLAALELENVTLVGNDSGGAICQLVAAERAERVGRIVLTPCDAFEVFPPTLFKYLGVVARIPGAMFALAQSMKIRPLRSLPIAFGWLTKRGIDQEIVDSWVRPSQSDSSIRRDGAAWIKSATGDHLLAATKKLERFERPVLLAWAAEDRLFKVQLAERLASTFPNARLELIEDSYTFVSEDQPERLADLIAAFVREPAPEPARAGGWRP